MIVCMVVLQMIVTLRFCQTLRWHCVSCCTNSNFWEGQLLIHHFLKKKILQRPNREQKDLNHVTQQHAMVE